MFNRFFLGMIGMIAVTVMLCVWVLYIGFFVYVPHGKMLIVISKAGDSLPGDEILAKPGQKGIMEEVRGEGLHFVMPYFYETEIATLTEIPPGKIGLVTAQVGKKPPAGAILADEDEKGIRRRILTPGRYRLNPYGYKVQLADAVYIRPGYVGCVTSMVGTPPKAGVVQEDGRRLPQFAGDGEKGIRADVLQPGIYYLNPLEFKVQEVEIGINQINFLDANEIRFPSKDAFDIAIEATVEWELLPENVAEVIAEFGGKEAIEEKVIVPQSKSIGRIQGSSYGAKEFLLGAEREKFQQTFTAELERVCEAKNITIHSAFIRQLSIPDNLLLPIRESFVAVQKEITAKVWESTKKSAGDLEREQAMISQRRAEVQAQTRAMIDTVMAETDQEVGNIEAETRLDIAQKQQEIANIEASKTVLLGEANAQVIQMKGEAQARGLQEKIKAFSDNPRAYVNFAFSQKLPKNLDLKLFYAGDGTFWTDLEKSAGIAPALGGKLIQEGRKGARGGK
jgi:regulator of protease activity HflC (stomatin/prohibitin superfamily)